MDSSGQQCGQVLVETCSCSRVVVISMSKYLLRQEIWYQTWHYFIQHFYGQVLVSSGHIAAQFQRVWVTNAKNLQCTQNLFMLSRFTKFTVQEHSRARSVTYKYVRLRIPRICKWCATIILDEILVILPMSGWLLVCVYIIQVLYQAIGLVQFDKSHRKTSHRNTYHLTMSKILAQPYSCDQETHFRRLSAVYYYANEVL